MPSKTIPLYPDQANNANIFYKLKIRLEGSDPPIYRKVLVPADINLLQLHLVIQLSMGWMNAHLFQFSDKKWDNLQFRAGVPDDMGILSGPKTQPANEVKLKTLIQKFGLKHFLYLYDFGDSWWHKITVMKTSQKDIQSFKGHPVCIDAAGAGPPEDIGGIRGYYEFLNIINDKNHPAYQEYREWMGLSDRQKYDPDFVNFELIDMLLKGVTQEEIWHSAISDWM